VNYNNRALPPCVNIPSDAHDGSSSFCILLVIKSGHKEALGTRLSESVIPAY